MTLSHQFLDEILRTIRPNQVTDRQKADLNAFKQEVTTFLQRAYRIHDDRVSDPFAGGSQAKGTEMALNYDLDLFLPFRDGFRGGPQGMKADLLQRLKAQYEKQGILVRDQRVSVGLRKLVGMNTLIIDVVPGMEKGPKAYDHHSKDEDKKYLILYDREANKPRTTNVHRQSRLIKEKMLNFRDTVRLLKAWRHKEQHIISSYALELMVYRAAIAKGAPATGAPDLLLKHVLQHNIPLLESNQSLHDFGANYDWPDFLKPAAKTQLAGRWKKLLDALTAHDTTQLRSFFP
jgi:hypothetical protein